MASSTTIIFIPGAWHSPDCLHRVIKILDEAGHYTDKAHLPSVGAVTHFPDIEADVSEIRSHITNAVDAGQKVVIVAHSYSGVPSSEAINGLDYKTRQQSNLPGGVVHLFLCSAYIIPEGQSLLSAFGGEEIPWLAVSQDQLEVNPTQPAERFYNDMSSEDIRQAVAQLKPHSYQTFQSLCT